MGLANASRNISLSALPPAVVFRYPSRRMASPLSVWYSQKRRRKGRRKDVDGPFSCGVLFQAPRQIGREPDIQVTVAQAEQNVNAVFQCVHFTGNKKAVK